MGKRLFVGGLPFQINDQQLREMFAAVGTVTEANVVIDRLSGRSKGFGFVDMTSDEEAAKAIQTLNNTEIEGRRIVVNEARPREERPQRDFGGGGYNRSGGGGNRGNRGSGGGSGRW